jgi:hypothetical protein
VGRDVVRRFSIGDGLILIAATAVGLAATRTLVKDVAPRPFRAAIEMGRQRGSGVEAAWALACVLTVFLVVPMLAAWTAGGLLVSLRRPRPPWRRLALRPGSMACLAAMATFPIASFLTYRAWMSRSGAIMAESYVFGSLAFGTAQAGAAVFWCWVGMDVAGRWGPKPTWPDRLGRALGVAWIVAAAPAGYAALVLL